MNDKLKILISVTLFLGILFSIPQPAMAVLYEVEIEDYAFIPASLDINPGDMIRWKNRDAIMHSSTSDNGVWDSGLLAENQTYTFTFAVAGVYPYHCSPHPFMVDTIIVGTPTGVNDLPSSIPEQIEISQNYPNPFNAQTAIEYSLPSDSHVRIVVYNLLGQNIETLVDQDQSAGSHIALWNAGNVPTGVYFYRIESGEFTKTLKMLLTK